MLIVRLADKADCEIVFKWRNDKTTVQFSKSRRVVTWEEHKTWFLSSLQAQNRLLLICEEKNKLYKIGVVHFDLLGARAIVSINLSPKMRGKGQAKICLKSAIELCINLHPFIQSIDAEIKVKNERSRRVFMEVGFKLVNEDNGLLLYQYVV